MLQLHNLNGRQVLGRLRLGTALVAGDEEQGGVHDGGAVQHGGHKNVVAGTIDKADVSHQTVFVAVHGKVVLLKLVVQDDCINQLSCIDSSDNLRKVDIRKEVK